ncbi:MAG: hypothetical protein KDD94_05925 [Calditrichaeota bacterium]|nr:hypothetical protein [Calditrichota bacterium]
MKNYTLIQAKMDEILFKIGVAEHILKSATNSFHKKQIHEAIEQLKLEMYQIEY